MLVYVDDCIIISQNKSSIDKFIGSFKFGSEKVDFTDKGSMDKYLGVDIKKLPDTRLFIYEVVDDSPDPPPSAATSALSLPCFHLD